jgi:hypothetical protein
MDTSEPKSAKGIPMAISLKRSGPKLGDITFAIPQVREGGFYPSALEKGMRSEQALMIALAEMYMQGVSPEGSKQSQKNCVALRYRPCKSVEQPNS